MKNLGLVCMQSNQSFQKGFTGLKAINKATQSQIDEKLLKATMFNLIQTYENIQYCIDNDIKAYRISSEVVPFYEFWDWEGISIIINSMNKIKKLANDNNITLIIHPDVFTILNSPDHNVVTNSIKIQSIN